MKKTKKTRKKKQAIGSGDLSRFFDVHTRSNRHKISIFKKIVTKKRIYISMATFVLIILASTAVYAVNSVLDLKNRNYTSPTTSLEASVKKQSDSSYTSDIPTDNTTKQQSSPINCNDISVAAEAKLLNTTSALIYPQYGDSRAVFDAYNNAYREAYNTYINTVKPHNCPVNIADKGTIQYGSPTCTPVYSNKIVVVLKNQIISGVNLDMAEYNRWYIAGHNWDSSYPSYQSNLDAEQNYIQNKNNTRVRGYVNTANADLTKIFCPSLNPADYYVNLF